jgi:hypothetical protein
MNNGLIAQPGIKKMLESKMFVKNIVVNGDQRSNERGIHLQIRLQLFVRPIVFAGYHLQSTMTQTRQRFRQSPRPIFPRQEQNDSSGLNSAARRFDRQMNPVDMISV